MIELHLENACNFYRAQNRSSPYDEYSSNDYANEKRDRRRDLDETEAQERRESESDNRTMFDFYTRQACCRECG